VKAKCRVEFRASEQRPSGHRRGAPSGSWGAQNAGFKTLPLLGHRLHTKAAKEIHDQDYEENSPQARADSSARSPS